MKIGLLSDTHGFLKLDELNYFKNCDEIWHAGDIGDIKVTDQLTKLKPLYAVFGNIDDQKVRNTFPEILVRTINGCKIAMIHIAGKPPTYNSKVKSLIKNERPNILICGHSHLLKVEYDKINKLLFINPGAAGNHGFHKVRTFIRFSISNEGKPENMDVVELGTRGR